MANSVHVMESVMMHFYLRGVRWRIREWVNVAACSGDLDGGRAQIAPDCFLASSDLVATGFVSVGPLGGPASGSSISSALLLGLARGQEKSSAARCNNRFAAIEHARGAWIGFPFGWLLCGAEA
jgi:hypothetical protein